MSRSSFIVGRIARLLEDEFAPLIDMSDWRGKAEDRQAAFLSRALAAACLKGIANVEAKRAADAVVDGFGDNGLDAIMFDQAEDIFYFVTSKWSADGSGCPVDEKACLKFVSGINSIIDGNLTGLNAKVQRKTGEINAFLLSKRHFRVEIITAHNATQPISAHGKRKIDNLVSDHNSSVPTARASHINQSGVYIIITSAQEPKPIDLTISLQNWGKIERPYEAYYGHVDVLEVAVWWKAHGNRLYRRNLRNLLQDASQTSDVNEALRKTLENDPSSFWYFNNGITIICKKIQQSPSRMLKRDIGIFNCEDIGVVNGAQTVGIIGTAKLCPADENSIATNEAIAQSHVQVRLISLQHCPDGFGTKITQATNFQNAVRARDFASMDPNQHRLAIDLALDDRRYVYKSGESDPQGDEGCSITEAAQALGCAYSVELAGQAKREISRLFADPKSAPYTDLFNDLLTGPQLWRAVTVLRAVDRRLHQLGRSTQPRAENVAVHLNRIILHLVFRSEDVKGYRRDDVSEQSLVDAATIATDYWFPKVAAYVEAVHKAEYIQALCKNGTKCALLVETLLRQEPAQLYGIGEQEAAQPIGGQSRAQDLFGFIESPKPGRHR
jgi:hypothetical protein